jgi:hypothetical protein
MRLLFELQQAFDKISLNRTNEPAPCDVLAAMDEIVTPLQQSLTFQVSTQA